jgi:hypothetical protein
MLSMLEEVVLLAVDEKTGRLRSTRPIGTGYALAGAVFFDLALARRIDTDTEKVQVVSTEPTGDPVQDKVLQGVANHPELSTVSDWMKALAQYHEEFENHALDKLINKGVLRHEVSKLLWIIETERLAVADQAPQLDVKARLAQTILTDSIPDPRDIMLVSVAEASGLLEYVLSRTQLESRRERIAMLCHLETISREVGDAIARLNDEIRTFVARMH